MTGGYINATLEERMAYEVLVGPWPEPHTPQDVVKARVCVAMLRNEKRRAEGIVRPQRARRRRRK